MGKKRKAEPTEYNEKDVLMGRGKRVSEWYVHFYERVDGSVIRVDWSCWAFGASC